MKKIAFLLMIILTVSCGTVNQPYDMNDLRVGMSRGEVERYIGPYERVLSLSQTPYGYQEVFQYRNYHNRPYALEFVNDALYSAYYIADDYWYPMDYNYYPGYGQCVFPPNYRPNKPAPAPPHNHQRPPGNNHNINNPLPPAKEREPASQGRQPATQERQPATQERQPATQERQPATQERQPATSTQTNTSSGSRNPSNSSSRETTNSNSRNTSSGNSSRTSSSSSDSSKSRNSKESTNSSSGRTSSNESNSRNSNGSGSSRR